MNDLGLSLHFVTKLGYTLFRQSCCHLETSDWCVHASVKIVSPSDFTFCAWPTIFFLKQVGAKQREERKRKSKKKKRKQICNKLFITMEISVTYIEISRKLNIVFLWVDKVFAGECRHFYHCSLIV